MSRNNFWTSEKLMSVTAVLISIGTLFTILYQTNLMRKQQYASVLPYLEIWNSSPTSDSYKLLLMNNGVGPAFVEDIKVVFEGEVFKGDPIQFYRDHIVKKDTVGNFLHSNITKGRLIPAGEKIEMISITNAEEGAAKMRTLYGGGNAKVEIVYSSVYGERWLVRSGETPQKLD